MSLRPSKMAASRNLYPATSILTIGDSFYLVPPTPAASLSKSSIFDISVSTLQPVTVIRVDDLQTISSSWLRDRIDEMLNADDVYSQDFATNIIFQKSLCSNNQPLVEGDLSTALAPGKSTSW